MLLRVVAFRIVILHLIVGVAGCGHQSTPLYSLENPAAPIPNLGASYDPERTGTIVGRVIWDGAIPQPHSFRDAKVVTPALAAYSDPKNTLLPKINQRSLGVEGALVFVSKIDANRSRPWDYPPVRVEMKDTLIDILQPESSHHCVGFVKVGDAIDVISYSSSLEMLRARGAAFFTIAFPAAEQMLSRVMPRPGVVELSSGTGNYWARAFIHVMEHPYVTRTDADGRFTLSNVPDGKYELVCWMPNWKVNGFDRDPENLNITRVRFCEPLQKSASITVERGETMTVEFTIRESEFAEKR